MNIYFLKDGHIIVQIIVVPKFMFLLAVSLLSLSDFPVDFQDFHWTSCWTSRDFDFLLDLLPLPWSRMSISEDVYSLFLITRNSPLT
jgi:hypothetical protein